MAEKEEKTEQAEELSGFSGIDDAVEKFHDSQANKEPESPGEGKSEDKPAEPVGEAKTLPEDEGKTKEQAKSLAMELRTDDEGFFVDKDGNRKPAIIKVDGEDREVDTWEKYQTHANFGFRADLRGEELNRREAELGKKEPIIQALIDAQKDGRLTIKGSNVLATPTGDTPAQGSEIDLSELDPDVAEILKPIISDMKELRSDNKAMKELLTNQFVEKAHTQLKSQVETAMTDYPLARTKDGGIREQVWKKLAEVDEASGRARYTPDEAVKLVHNEMNADFQAHAKSENWEHVDDKKREEIATDWWAKKEDGEKAPVSRPDSAKVGSSKSKGDKPRFTGIEDAMDQFREDHVASVKTGARY